MNSCSGLLLLLSLTRIDGIWLHNRITYRRIFWLFQCLVSVVADGIYIHSLHDMKVLHVISNSLHVVPSACVLSPGKPLHGHDTPSYLAYSDSGDMKIFDTVDLVSMQSNI